MKYADVIMQYVPTNEFKWV